MDVFSNLIFDYTLRNVALGAAFLGVVSGCLGVFAVLRKQSLLGDAISHAALPGIAVAFLLTRTKSPLILLLGAALAGWLATWLMNLITRHSRIKEDSSLGLVMSVFFGAGLVLLTFIQKIPDATQAGLENFLFGQAATVLSEDVLTIGALGFAALLIMMLNWKEFKLVSFDPEFGVSLGMRVRWIETLITSLLVVAIVLGLQTVGVVLMSAMVVAPAAAARQWTDHLGKMVTLSGAFGALAGLSGAIVSSLISKLPTGPTIVVAISIIVVISFLFGAKRGLVWSWISRQRSHRNIRSDSILEDLYTLAIEHDNVYHGHSSALLETVYQNPRSIANSLRLLQEKGLVVESGQGIWSLTAAGVKRAEQLAHSGEDE